MGKLNAKNMDLIERQKEEKKRKHQQLISTSFDLTNADHMQAIKKYTNEFELNANLMYLYQAMSVGLAAWGGSWVLGIVIPIPEFINSIVTAAFWTGIVGFGLGKLSINDFSEKRQEMKDIYNWCLKNGQQHYDTKSNNDSLLSQPDIQRMIKIMAPWCKTEFMIAWERVTKNEEQAGVVTNVVSAGYAALKSTFSFFSSAPIDANLNRLNELKHEVETRHFDLGTFNAAEHALRYFATNTDFRALMVDKIKEPLGVIKEQLPSALQGIAFAQTK